MSSEMYYLCNKTSANGYVMPPGPTLQSYNSGFEDGATSGNSTDGEQLFYVPPGLVALLSVLYGTISVITVIGNALVVIVILRNRHMQTVTNFFIGNLSVADVALGILSIPFQFQAALLQRWDLPHFLCPAAPFVKQLSVNVSIITLTLIAVDRYFAVVHPLRPKCQSRLAGTVMTVVWIFSVLSSIPTAVVFRVAFVPTGRGGFKPFCQPLYPSLAGVDLGHVYRLYLVAVQYFLPLLIITGAYVRIIREIWMSQTPGSAQDARDRLLNRNKRKIIKMLVIVVALFAFCWLPLQTYSLLSEIAPSINSYKYINIIWFASNWLAMSNSCINPFIYGLLNERFKQGFRLLFVNCVCCGRRQPVNSASTDSGSHKSSHEECRSIHDARIKRYITVSRVTRLDRVTCDLAMSNAVRDRIACGTHTPVRKGPCDLIGMDSRETDRFIPAGRVSSCV